jgi:cell division transport system permease protein
MAANKEMGAKISRVGWQKQLKAYALDNKQVAKQSFIRLCQQPVTSLMTWFVIGIALALPVSMYVALSNVQQLSKRWDGETQISVFLKIAIDQEDAEKLQVEIKAWPEVQSVALISKEQGMSDFEEYSGVPKVLTRLEKNPLPIVLEVLPKKESSDAEQAALLLTRLQALPQADLAQLDLDWVKRLAVILIIGEKITFFLVMLLSLGVLLVIGNTIRLEIENRRREIIVIKLIGGTDAFIRRPFLYTGFWYGLGGGLFATIMVAAGLALLSEPVAKLAGLYGSDYGLMTLSFIDTLSLWLMSGFLGLFGAWFAVAKHLDELQPS